jgi:hypothetical protein
MYIYVKDMGALVYKGKYVNDIDVHDNTKVFVFKHIHK